MKRIAVRCFFMALLMCAMFILMSQVVFADTYVTVTGSTVNIRSQPEINDNNRITTVPRGTILEVVAEAGDFFRIVLPDIGYAYISQQWVRFYSTTGVVAVPAAWIFDLPDIEDGTPISMAVAGDSLVVVSYYGYWYGIIYEGELAFIEKQHLYTPYFIDIPPARLTYNDEDCIRYQVVEKALRYLGRPYRWGGNGPYSFDCSGFVIYVLRPFGVTLPRRSRDMASSGVHVARNDLLPGDLVFFATSGGSTVSHVGMYIGNGQFIHSSSTRSGGVIISNLDSAYFTRTYVTARRVL